MSWNKDLLSKVSWLEKKNKKFLHLLISTYISKNDFWVVKYTWIKDDDVTRKDLFQKVPSMQVLTT